MNKRIEWSEIKDHVDLAAVATNLLGPAEARKGNRLLWLCPLHDDHHPSLDINIQKQLWWCPVCQVGGDAANLVMRVHKVGFPEAVHFCAEVTGVIPSSTATPPLARPPAKVPTPVEKKPTGLPANEALALVKEATANLWKPLWKPALSYLHARGLTDDTIRVAGLGFIPSIVVPTKAGSRTFWFGGIVIPWWHDTKLTRIKIRRFPDVDRKPKYAEAYSDSPVFYPHPDAIRKDVPLIFVEGEFDCLLLAQQLPEASVVTLGSAAVKNDWEALRWMLRSQHWFTAMDADKSGDANAARFPGRAVRVRPPEPDKDWTDVHKGGANRIRYIWAPHLSLSTPWEMLEQQTWGPRSQSGRSDR